MTKKHFIALADYVRKPGMMPAEIEHAINRAQCVDGLPEESIPELTDAQQNRLRREVLRAVASTLADFCIEQNGRFDRHRWLAYINGDHE